MRYLEVKNLGPVAEAKVDLEKDIQVVIGSQASGKSTIFRMVYFCQKVRDYILEFLMQEEAFVANRPEKPFVSCLKHLTGKYMECFGKTIHLQRFSIRYVLDDARFMEISLNEERFIRFAFSESIKNELYFLLHQAQEFHVRILPEAPVGERLENRRYMRNWMSGRLAEIFGNDQQLIYIPAGRSLLATISEHLLKSQDANMDLLMQEFCRLIVDTKQRFGSKIPEMLSNYKQTVSGQINEEALGEAYDLIRKILKADYTSESDGEKLYYDAKHYVQLLYASSGQHEALWILMLCYLIILENRRSLVIIDEPEAHLFPEAQRWIASLMVLTANATGSQILFTTHSPYILTALNVLALSGSVERQMQGEAIVPVLQRITPGCLAAYKIQENAGNNTLVSILDAETGLIEPEYIDSVSSDINSDFEKLLEKEILEG